ncbi:E-selectin-like [Bombina bombina]|uniref:E-selectin-like n=1 Tax=Bombina bombina TaxID=8345 RepID=UPI00235AF952|nr:E-selectin-like [Bombina bombina]
MIALFYFSFLSYGFSMFSGVHGWSYFYSSVNMTYQEARNYCKTHYTDLVAIQNQEEIKYLNEILPFNRAYYWIGIRKINNQWTWVGTNKKLTKEAENWASNEPNNKRKDEDCVEMYVGRKADAGKWNDASCKNRKVALCYTAACNATSCSGHGECIETINNYTCKCNEGFYGEKCDKVVTCEPLEQPDKGSFNCFAPNGNFNYGTSCEFSCQEGYDMDSDSTIHCTVSGWSSSAPQCNVINCYNLKTPDHGSMRCSGPFGEFLYNSSCEFSCDEGFELVGNNKLQCMGNSEWNGVVPQCTAVKCQAINNIDQGTVTCSLTNGDFTYKSSCHFKCSEGFALIGSESVQCTAQGEWTNEIPHCEVIQCERPVEPQYGLISCSNAEDNLPENSTCDFSCVKGFALVGSPSLLCIAPGQWTEEAPICKAVSCPDLTNPEQAKMDCEDDFGRFKYNSNCSFQCNEGFILIGTESLQCSSSGSWSAIVPECQAIQCQSLNAPENGNIHCQGKSTYNSRCSVTCAEGFNLIGASELTCASSGEWTSDIPECEAVQCPSLKAPENGYIDCQGKLFYNSKCSFTCAEGFKLIGASELNCEASGEWTSFAPTCEAVQCPSLNAPQNGLIDCQGKPFYNSRCSVTCAEGFNLIGASELTCAFSGEWTSDIPICEAVQCPSLKAPENGYIDCQEKSFYNSKCSFTCAEGFKLIGRSELNCEASGEWTSSAPTCEVVQCPSLKAPENGHIDCQGKSFYNSKCSFTCAEGFKLFGTSELNCESSGEWTSSAPKCEAVQCPSLNAPENGHIECQGKSSYNSRCSFTCAEGFKLMGASELTCASSGEWTSSTPTCEAVQCGTLPIPDMGIMNCTNVLGDFKFGTVCKFDCKDEWLLNGSNTLECSSDGKWSATIPTCEGPKVPDDPTLKITVGAVATGASVLSTASLLAWLVKRLRKSAKKFTPSSSCQTLENAGIYQNAEDV